MKNYFLAHPLQFPKSNQIERVNLALLKKEGSNMKKTLRTILRFVMVSAVVASIESSGAYGLELGQIKVAGTACFNPEASQAMIQDQVLMIQTATVVKKLANVAFARGTCLFSLPLALGVNERLVIRHFDMIGEMNLSPGASLKSQTEVFFAGGRGPILTANQVAGSSREKSSIFVSQDSEILTECGASVILRGNSSVTISGGLSRSTGRLDGVHVFATVEACE